MKITVEVDVNTLILLVLSILALSAYIDSGRPTFQKTATVHLSSEAVTAGS